MIHEQIKPDHFKETLSVSLQDPEHAVEYLKAALEETDMPEMFLVALHDVAEVWGMNRLLQNTKLNRFDLYTMLSHEGNPDYRKLQKVLDVLGFKLSIELKKAS